MSMIWDEQIIKKKKKKKKKQQQTIIKFDKKEILWKVILQ